MISVIETTSSRVKFIVEDAMDVVEQILVEVPFDIDDEQARDAAALEMLELTEMPQQESFFGSVRWVLNRDTNKATLIVFRPSIVGRFR